MTHSKWKSSRIRFGGFGWLKFCVLVFGFSSTLIAQDPSGSTERLFQDDSFPWYDANSGDAKPLTFEARPEIRSKDRNTIPTYIPRQPATPGTGAPLGVGEGMNLLSWVVLGFALLMILILLVWAFLKLESRSQPSLTVSSRRSLAESIEQLPFEVEEDSGDFRTLAQRAYDAGNYRKAIIHLYSHVLVALDQANLIRLRKGKTNRQYLRELGRKISLTDYFQPTMESFESVFFGDHDIRREDFEQHWQRLPGFQAELERNQLPAKEIILER